MQIIEVIPLTNLPPQVPQLLSYFFNEPLLKGSIVEIPLNNRKVPAVVISSVPLEENKIMLKKSGFQLKKISGIINKTPLLTEIQFKIALWLSKNYFAPLGMCFKTVLPPFFGNKKYTSFSYPRIEPKNDKLHKPIILISKAKEIINHIKDEIKETVNRKQQVLIIAPEISIAQYFYDFFTRSEAGAEHYKTSFLHSGISPLKAYGEWEKISSGETDIVIGTRQVLFAPFSNLGLIIMEDPANEAYKSDMTPKYNPRDLVEKIAIIYSVKLLLISSMPDILSFAMVKNGKFEQIQKNHPETIAILSENMLNEIKSGNFNIFSRELKNNVGKFAKDNKKILIFSTRKGYSSSLMCENCSFYFKCPQCSVPFRIYKSPAASLSNEASLAPKGRELLVCHRCSSVQKIPDHCPNCHSYKLKSAGFAGSEKIKEELGYILQTMGIKKDVFIFDSSSVKILKQESELTKKIKESDSYICIATQAIFGRRFELNFDLIGIPNMDSLTTFPDFKVEEDLFLQFEKLIDFEPKKIIIQTFDPDNKMAGLIISRKYPTFYEGELLTRGLFMYPPFARLVKLSYSSPDKSRAEYESRILNEKLKMVIAQKKLENKIKILGPSPAFIEKQRNIYLYNLILKLAPDFEVNEVIKFVPSSWSIDV